MNMLRNVGLIECSTTVTPSRLESSSRSKEFYVKKVLIKKDVAEHVAKSNYPKAEIVWDLDSIINDQTIELVIVSGSRNGCLNQVAQALKAGKQVRLIQ